MTIWNWHQGVTVSFGHLRIGWHYLGIGRVLVQAGAVVTPCGVRSHDEQGYCFSCRVDFPNEAVREAAVTMLYMTYGVDDE